MTYSVLISQNILGTYVDSLTQVLLALRQYNHQKRYLFESYQEKSPAASLRHTQPTDQDSYESRDYT